MLALSVLQCHILVVLWEDGHETIFRFEIRYEGTYELESRLSSLSWLTMSMN